MREDKNILNCPRCKMSFAYPELTSEVKSEVAKLNATRRPIAAIKHIRDNKDMDLGDCKALTFHLTRQKGICHRCDNEIGSDEIVSCEKCKCLNLNW